MVNKNDVRGAQSLHDLLFLMCTQVDHLDDDWYDLPTFGESEPVRSDAMNAVWSWNETHMLVGLCQSELTILPRTDTRAAYLDLFSTLTEAIAYEHRVLSIGEESLPPEAIAVRDGGEPSPAYWKFLIGQVQIQEREST